MAYILRDQGGKEHLSGPTCLSTHAKVDKSTQTYPNFAKACKGGVSDHKDSSSAPKKECGKEDGLKEGDPETEYLVLRFRLLGNFPGMRVKTLENAYSRYLRDGQLTADDRQHITRLIAKVSKERPEYSPKNLTACYAYSHWIKVALEGLSVDKQGFLRQMLLSVMKNLYLSPAQAAAVNKWFVKIEGAPVLDPEAFTPRQRQPA
ncbi:hypothetical protein [Geomonas subterranea]|uniref:hypothetical protein n=1 Tax=Geomonas subterranea TaxID=2847989 RepID=UPI001CD5D008|nr:hypothetical protein [Geomonas fuzhouensis]